nr:hypothetical protein CFP56_10139 [Quercus suber]
MVASASRAIKPVRLSPTMGPPRIQIHNMQLLASTVGPLGLGEFNYRVLVDGQHVRYITIGPNTFPKDNDFRAYDHLVLSEILAPFPAKDWTTAHIEKDLKTGDKSVRTEMIELPHVARIWHPVMLYESEFTFHKKIGQRVHVVTHPKLNGGLPIIVKLAIWPWEITSIEVETAAYQWIKNRGIGPRFLGHVAEGLRGRVIGFAIELVRGATPPGPEDAEGCRKVLGRLHEHGIKYGNLDKKNFLTREGRDVLLVDYEKVQLGCPLMHFAQEVNVFLSSLQDTNGDQQGQEFAESPDLQSSVGRVQDADDADLKSSVGKVQDADDEE